MAVFPNCVLAYASFFILCSSSTNASDVWPVILIPGDGGSQVEAKLNKTAVVHYVCEKTSADFFNLWLNIELLVPVIIDCWVDNMKLYYNATTRKSQDAPGVEIRIPGWGTPSVVEWIDPSQASSGAYFNSIAVQLVALGYARNTTLLGAPYDFRRGPSEQETFFNNMKSLVEDTFNRTGRGVVLMAHSMGGPMSALFLRKQSQAWKDKYIRALISLNGAWAGSVKALKVYAVGDSMGSYVLRESIMKEVQVTTSSLAWLLPSPYFWNSSDVLVETGEKNYTLGNLQQFFTDLGYPDGWEMWKDTEKYVKDFSPPGVEVHCLHGAGVDTVDRLIYKPKKFPDGSPSFETGDGDGTVNLRSLESCTTWSGKQKKPVYHQVFSKVDHMGILHDPRVLAYIKSVLTVKL